MGELNELDEIYQKIKNILQPNIWNIRYQNNRICANKKFSNYEKELNICLDNNRYQCMYKNILRQRGNCIEYILNINITTFKNINRYIEDYCINMKIEIFLINLTPFYDHIIKYINDNNYTYIDYWKYTSNNFRDNEIFNAKYHYLLGSINCIKYKVNIYIILDRQNINIVELLIYHKDLTIIVKDLKELNDRIISIIES